MGVVRLRLVGPVLEDVSWDVLRGSGGASSGEHRETPFYGAREPYSLWSGSLVESDA